MLQLQPFYTTHTLHAFTNLMPSWSSPRLQQTLNLCHKCHPQLLPEETPGKVGGPPGDAFEVVYDQVTDKVRRNMHAADPVLGEYIRRATLRKSCKMAYRQRAPEKCAAACTPPTLCSASTSGASFVRLMECE